MGEFDFRTLPDVGLDLLPIVLTVADCLPVRADGQHADRLFDLRLKIENALGDAQPAPSCSSSNGLVLKSSAPALMPIRKPFFPPTDVIRVARFRPPQEPFDRILTGATLWGIRLIESTRISTESVSGLNGPRIFDCQANRKARWC